MFTVYLHTLDKLLTSIICSANLSKGLLTLGNAGYTGGNILGYWHLDGLDWKEDLWRHLTFEVKLSDLQDIWSPIPDIS